MEIFDKAIQLAKMALERGHPEVLDSPPPSQRAGDWRLYMQAVKVLVKAVENVAREGRNANAANVIDEIEHLAQQHGTGWEKVSERGKTWYYKDYETADDLIDTLGFIQSLNVVFKRMDENPIEQTRHLRLTQNDYHQIFNPKKHFSMEVSRGH